MACSRSSGAAAELESARRRLKGRFSASLSRAALLAIILAAAALVPCAAQKAEGVPLEYQVKAAFLLNFTKFVEWPQDAFASPDAPIGICILGEDPFGGALDQIVAGEAINGRKLVVERIRRSPPQHCRVLFVSKSEGSASKLLAGLGHGTLTVGEDTKFLSDGGMIAFVIENRRVRFDVSQSAIKKGGLKISSRLLNVARSVEK